jgi:hypothetical protein
MILTRDQPVNFTNTITICLTVQHALRYSINKWHLHRLSPSLRSLRPVTNRNNVLPLGMPPIQKRRNGGTQTTAVPRIPESYAASGAMDMLITPVRHPSSLPQRRLPNQRMIYHLALHFSSWYVLRRQPISKTSLKQQRRAKSSLPIKQQSPCL